MAAEFRRLLVAQAIALLCTAMAGAVPLTGLSYTYDLSAPDVDPGGFETFVVPHAFADDDIVNNSDLIKITTAGLLTDGNLGSLTKVPFGFPPLVIFANGTYAGFRSDLGIGHAPQPKIDIDLGGRFELNSFTLYYLVEDSTSIYSPRPVPDTSPPAADPDFDALTVYGSTNGVNFASLALSNDFHPLFGLDGDVGSGAEEVRSVTLSLAGATASHLSIDVRTPWAFIFLSELIVDGAPVAALAGDFNDDHTVNAADYTVWRDNLGTHFDLHGNGDESGPSAGVVDLADYGLWKSNYGATSGGAGDSTPLQVPEPATFPLYFLGFWLLHDKRRQK